MNDLVLGGAGLVGAPLARHLRAAGRTVDVVDLKLGTDARELDLSRYSDSDRIWFLAWDTGGARYLSDASAQHQMYRSNCLLSANVFDAIARSGRPALFVTSQLAGQHNAYGLSKLLAEHWARALGLKIARLWNVYGWEEPGSRAHVVAHMVHSALTSGTVECQTDGQERRRLLFDEDCAEGLVRLFDGPQQEAEIAGSEWVSIADLARTIGRAIGVPCRLGEFHGAECLIDPERSPDGWQPRTSLEQGIARVVAEARAWLEVKRQSATGAR